MKSFKTLFPHSLVNEESCRLSSWPGFCEQIEQRADLFWFLGFLGVRPLSLSLVFFLRLFQAFCPCSAGLRDFADFFGCFAEVSKRFSFNCL